MRLSAEGEGGQIEFAEVNALGRDDAESIEERGLSGVGLCDTAQANLAMRCGRQNDVVRESRSSSRAVLRPTTR